MSTTWKENEVWAATIDEKYYVTVNRTDSTVGLLTVKDLVTLDTDTQQIGEVVYQESVSLPRRGVRICWEDTMLWQDMVAKFRDEKLVQST